MATTKRQSQMLPHAGISKGAIYLHFPSKEAMPRRLSARNGDHPKLNRLSGRECPDGGRCISLYYIRCVWQPSVRCWKAFMGHRNHVLRDLLRTLAPKFANARSRQDAADFVKRYQDMGLIRQDADPKVIAFIMAFVRYGFLMIDEVIPPDEMPDFESVLTLLADVLGRGLGKSGGDTEAGRDIFNEFSRAVEKGKAGNSAGPGNSECKRQSLSMPVIQIRDPSASRMAGAINGAQPTYSGCSRGNLRGWCRTAR